MKKGVKNATIVDTQNANFGFFIFIYLFLSKKIKKNIYVCKKNKIDYFSTQNKNNNLNNNDYIYCHRVMPLNENLHAINAILGWVGLAIFVVNLFYLGWIIV